ncbi:MAG TPA: hypothetical protein VMR70_08570 [Flavisolibacter sp.]|nr:hypothetical protein [Flavisolibacter sp.]
MIRIEEIRNFLAGHVAFHSALERLIEASLASKRTSFGQAEFPDEYDFLKDTGYLQVGSAQSFSLDYERLEVCQVLLDVAEKRLKLKLPTDVIGGLEFADRFALAIREPQPRQFWYENLERDFERYVLIYLNHIHHVDITAFLYSITEELEESHVALRSFGMRYRDAFPFLLDNTETSFRVIQHLHSSEQTRSDALEALSPTGRKNPDKAKELLAYAKANNAVAMQGVLPNLIIGLFETNPDLYLQEAFTLFDASAAEGIHALAWINYSEEKHIREAFEFVTAQPTKEMEYLRGVPTFITRLIKNEHTPADLKAAGFNLLNDYLDIDDDDLKNNLVWRVSMIDGHDEEKFALLPKVLAWGRPQVLNNYFNHFASPTYLFTLIRDSYTTYGLNTNFDLFKTALHSQFHTDAALFETELLNLLTHNLAIVRFAGFQVLTSGYGGIYQVDLLKLNEIKQLRIIDTLLQLPTHIEDLFPLILQLRKSAFTAVTQKLNQALVELIWAYDRGLMELADQHLDRSAYEDKNLLETLSAAFAEYEMEKALKKKVKEFSPFENELELMEQFYRLEQEKNAEMMEKASERSFFSQIGKNISVIRGSGFNSELNKNIAMMGKMEFSRMMDQRYSINPEGYEWNFKLTVLGKNYSTDDEV